MIVEKDLRIQKMSICPIIQNNPLRQITTKQCYRRGRTLNKIIMTMMTSNWKMKAMCIGYIRIPITVTISIRIIFFITA